MKFYTPKYLILALLLAVAFLGTAQNSEHPFLTTRIDSLIKLNRKAIHNGDFKKAFQLINAATQEFNNDTVKSSAVYGKVIFNKGRTHDFNGDTKEAQKFYTLSLSILENTLGPEHVEVASSLNNLGYIYFVLGNYEKTEALYLRAMQIRKKVLGEAHPDYAGSVNNLASLYRKMGDYERAEPMYIESKRIRASTLGTSHPDYGASLNNLANLYLNMGIYKKAESLFLEAKDLLEKSVGTKHLDYGQSINSLAILYMLTENNKKAESLFLQSLEIRKHHLGTEHPLYAQNLNNLANLYTNDKRYLKAEELLLEAIEIRKLSLGENHPEYAQSLNNIGRVYLRQEKFELAEKYFLNSLSIIKSVFGKSHPEYPENLTYLANLYYQTNKTEKAKRFFLEANKIEKDLMINGSRHLSKTELNNYISVFNQKQYKLLSLAAAHPDLAGRVYDNSLFYKGFLLNATQKTDRLAMQDSSTSKMFLELKAINRRLAIAHSTSIAKRIKTEALLEEANRLEKEITTSVAMFGEAFRQVKWQEVQAQLSSDEVTIEFVDYPYSLPKKGKNILYTAIILKSHGAPKFIELFNEKSIDSLFSQNVSRKSDYVNFLYSVSGRGAIPMTESVRSLYDLIWKPLEKELEGIQTIYFSPSGLLHRINISAIAIDEERTISDKYNTLRLNSTRSLVTAKSNEIDNMNASLFGGIQYEIDTSFINDKSGTDLQENTNRNYNYFNAHSSEDSEIPGWTYLRWTENEVDEIFNLVSQNNFNSHKYMNFNATEDLFKQIGKRQNSPRLLHLATHGFFFSDTESKQGQNTDEPIFKRSANPMIRSGLLMAGANHVWKGNPRIPNKEDGILTAFEISQMNLSTTELVILSACETGLGDIAGNEGVYGLQRAFKIAGCKYIIMSLWQVPDRQTKDFMISFYKYWLQEDQTIPNAFRLAQDEMKNRFYDPFLWAGFVLVE